MITNEQAQAIVENVVSSDNKKELANLIFQIALVAKEANARAAQAEKKALEATAGVVAIIELIKLSVEEKKEIVLK